MSIIHILIINSLINNVLLHTAIIGLNTLKTMTTDENLEKSSKDYKKSQYGSWYKKSAENKKEIPDPQENSFLSKLKKLFKK